MAIRYEFWASANCLIEGDVSREDASFDHPFGKHKAYEFVISNFSVKFYHNNEEFDVTESVQKNNKLQYSEWKGRLIEMAMGGEEDL